jgi:hypothetical protein
MMAKRKKSIKDLEAIREVVFEAIRTHNEEFLIELIYKLQEEYNDIAKLSTMGEYKSTWTHKKTLDYITKET